MAALDCQKYLDKKVSVLIDKIGKNYVEGNSLEMKRVRINSLNYELGDIVEVEIGKAFEWILVAK